MTAVLQIVIAVVLVALCAFLVPLLIQLRRTAAAVERLAESAREDLKGIAEDVHQVRQRVDGLADLAATSLSFPANLGELIASLVRAVPDLLARKSPGWVSLILKGLSYLGAFFLRPRPDN